MNLPSWVVPRLTTTNANYARWRKTAILNNLHWLPVCYWIQYKLALMMYMAHTGQTMSYIKDVWHQSARTQLVAVYDPPTPPTTRYREHGPSLAWEHSVAGPSTWNSLPEFLRRTDCTQTFKRRRKTHFLTSTSALLCFNFSLFIDSCNARPVRLVVDLALNTIEQWTLNVVKCYSISVLD